jgi:hypothetical protein
MQRTHIAMRLRFWVRVERLAYHVMMVARAKQRALGRRKGG